MVEVTVGLRVCVIDGVGVTEDVMPGVGVVDDVMLGVGVIGVKDSVYFQ